ncbi:hypothetical protein ACQKCU_14470 [Heyndrickxia sporothermodurans]
MLFSIGTEEKISARSIKSVKDTLEAFEHQKLSLKQSIDLAYQSVLKWNKNAQLLQAINIDLDKSGKSFGTMGKENIGMCDLQCLILISHF